MSTRTAVQPTTMPNATAPIPEARARTAAPAAGAVPGSETRAHRTLIVASLAVGAVLGFGGNFLGPGAPQTVAHGISSIGLAVAGTLLALSFLRQGRDAVAAGFLLLTVAEIVMWNNGREGEIATTGFAAAVLFYAPALLLISLPPALPVWSRIAGALSGLAFGAHGGLFLLGSPPSPDGPLAGTGYALLTVALIGWIVATLRPTATTTA